MKNANICQIAKVISELRVLLSFCLTFCQFEPGVTYKKARSSRSICENQESISKRGIGSFKIILEKTSIPLFGEFFKNFQEFCFRIPLTHCF